MTRNVTPTHCHFVKILIIFCTEQIWWLFSFLSNVPVKTDKQTDLGKSDNVTMLTLKLLV